MAQVLPARRDDQLATTGQLQRGGRIQQPLASRLQSLDLTIGFQTDHLSVGHVCIRLDRRDRLMAGGLSKNQALQLMASALRVEMNRMLSEATPFDNQKYAALLAKINPG